MKHCCDTTRKSFVALSTSILALLTQVSDAATIVNNASWPASPDFQTVDANTASPGGRGISGTRQIRQTIQTSSDIDLTHIYLSSSNYNNEAFTIKFFEVSDVEASSWTAGSQVGSTITVAAAGTTVIGPSNLQISLNLAEQFTLSARNSGTQGYGIEIALANTSDPFAFIWQHANDTTDYITGRYYNESGTAQLSYRDMGIALVNIPEPGSLTIFGSLCGLILLRRSRNRSYA